MIKDELIVCIDKVLGDCGLSIEEIENYNNNKYSIDKSKYISVFPKIQDITHANGKTYVNNLKVMLAQNLYKDASMVKMSDALSKTLKIPEPPIGWYVSEKWDGIRAIWDGSQFISRGSSASSPKVYTYVPDFFKELMPPGIPLDGEIWIGRGEFSKTSRLSTLKIGSSYTKKQLDALWMGTSNETRVKYKVYDLPNSIQPFEKRMCFLKKIIENRKELWDKEHGKKTQCPLQLTEQILIKNTEQLFNTYKNLTSLGAEGVMLRAPNSPYEGKRSKYLLKYKIKEDAEAIVKDYMIGEGRLSGLLGALRCELIINRQPSGIMFNVGTGFSDIQRTEYNNEGSKFYIPLGSVISFSYMELSKDSVPRHPVYRGIRDDVSLKEAKTEEGTRKDKDKEEDFKQKFVDTFKVLIKTVETSKEQNWQFKRKSYNQVVNILESTRDPIQNINQALKILREGGAKFDGEEAYFTKNGEYKSKIVQKMDLIIKTGVYLEAEIYSEDPKVKAITELTTIPEIGPAAAIKLYALGIETIADLNTAYIKDNKLLNNKQVIGLKYYSDLEKRIPRNEMDKWNKFFKEILDLTINKLKTKKALAISFNANIELVGSYRRKAESSGDIDVLVSSNSSENEQKLLMSNFIKNLLATQQMDKDLVFSTGKTKFMGLGKIYDYYRHIDIFYYSEKEYPFALLFSTGSGQFNIEMRAYAIKMGYSLSEKDLKYIGSKTTKGEIVEEDEYMSDIGKPYPINEEDIFNFLGLKYIKPENRQSGQILKK